jgi:phosphomannomutase
MSEKLSCFKAYDVRGVVPEELNEDIALRIGRALAVHTGGKTAVVGHDSRLSSPSLRDAIANGLTQSGVDTFDIGLSGTEMIYFATAYYEYDIGVMITASHNPPQYNGLKMVRSESRPISGDSGLLDVERLARLAEFTCTGLGKVSKKDVYADFTMHLLKVVSPKELKPLRVIANAGNGCAGLAIESLQPHIPVQIEPMHFEPDGTFPNGVPNPILEESRRETIARMRAEKYDFGVAWDGDYDRCFFFDENGQFIEGYYIVGLLAQDVLQKKPGSTIIYDSRLIWNTEEVIRKHGGRGVMSKAGHAFIKERMRQENAEYGGEMSAHHYFRDHWFCDSGMIPFLQIARLVSVTGRTLGDLVSEMQARYPCSGEVNLRVSDASVALAQALSRYSDGEIDRLDGVSVSYPNWRFNLRPSNTEPVVRLNVESKRDKALVEEKVQEIVATVGGEIV